MKFIHIADIHFDTPFKTLSDRANLGVERRIEQRKAFKKMIEFAKEKQVDCILIAGDLYEHEYISKTTLEYINSLFCEIPNIKIFITPGNHDPYLKNSYYNTYKFADNVTIFTSKLEKKEEKNYNVYGYGFDNFEMENKIQKDELEKIKLNIKNNVEKNKINIFISHGDIYTPSKYNYMSINALESVGFDYIALGHIHKRDKYYSGSLISLGFDEIGEHGFIYGEINENNKTLEYTQNNAILKFIKADERELIYKDVDVSNINSQEELIENLNNIETGSNLYEINLIGTRRFEISINLKIIQENIIKIKDSTQIKDDINLDENEKTLSGFFVKNLREKLENKEITEKEFNEIIALGKSVLNK